MKKSTIKKLSIVIPCYSSEKFLHNTVDDIRTELFSKGLTEYEIILVNDCSPDNTFDEIKKISSVYNNIIGINLAKNFGQHAAIMAGLNHTSGDVVVCMDDDGQTQICEVWKLLAEIEKGHDVVYARYNGKKHKWYRNVGSKLNSLMTEIMLDKPKSLYISSYFAAKKYVIKEILKYDHSYPYLMGLIFRTTKDITNVVVEHKERTIGTSGYTMKKLLSLWMNGFTAFSIKPLRIASFFGVVCAAMGFICLIYIVIKRIMLGNQVVIGWSSMISITLFIGGIIMCILGMIGEYVGRIYICINNAPQYVIKEIVGEDNDR